MSVLKAKRIKTFPYPAGGPGPAGLAIAKLEEAAK
jgi:hypothetical protein